MEQMYLVEIFIDKVSIFLSEDDKNVSARKLTMKVKFGPKTQFIIKEGQLAVDDGKKSDDVIECDNQNRRKFTRTIRIGKSMLFPSYPDTVLRILSKFPLELEVWDDDENEGEIFVGIGSMEWDRAFFFMLKETAESCKRVEPLSIKQMTPLMAECCCKQVGEVHFILRLSALGDNIITEFQQLMKAPDTFVFRTNRAPSMFQCKRIEDGDPNFCMVGSLYETTTLEDPTTSIDAQPKIEVCTELQSCGGPNQNKNVKCEHSQENDDKKIYPIDKIRMGDITGPCGNTNCPLAHKVKTYIRNLDTYKKEAAGKVSGNKDQNATKNVCGACVCKDDRWHREQCIESKADNTLALCKGCGGQAKPGHTCDEMQNRTGSNHINKSTVGYVYNYNVTEIIKIEDKTSLGLIQSLYNDCLTSIPNESDCQNLNVNYKSNNAEKTLNSDIENNDKITCNESIQSNSGCGCRKRKLITPVSKMPPLAEEKSDIKSAFNIITDKNYHIYNTEIRNEIMSKTANIYNCTAYSDIKDCMCDPPQAKPPCSTFNCECIPKSIDEASRKQHKPFCPAYRHKSNCPVHKMNDEPSEEKKKNDDDEEEQEALPYGLPPIVLGPCPVLGRPCTVPDGFARMYKTAALAPQPPSYSEAGKVCCSKEFERIKKALNEYMKHEKDNDFKCVNRFNVDTERRCCDKEQMLLTMMGKGCCGEHKLSIQDKYKEDKKCT